MIFRTIPESYKLCVKKHRIAQLYDAIAVWKRMDVNGYGWSPGCLILRNIEIALHNHGQNRKHSSSLAVA